jgi:hypothetical protein
MVAAEKIGITDDTLTVDLDDGRTISVPLSWYPRLLHGSAQERNNRRLIGKGEGIHWPDLDEDIKHLRPLGRDVFERKPKLFSKVARNPLSEAVKRSLEP